MTNRIKFSALCGAVCVMIVVAAVIAVRFDKAKAKTNSGVPELA
jgi:hypothetical protein